jgi:hypothetical protein
MSELTGLQLLRKPFDKSQISKLPKPTKPQTDEIKANFKAGIRCALCGGWHHKDVVHLDYVGHAALTNRLLDCDPEWTWEPLSKDEAGLPLFDRNGGLWIKLTVCGVARLGYGDAQGKQGGDAIKEAIGDALRNSAMRFGAALDLWSKADLHAEEEVKTENKVEEKLPFCTKENFDKNADSWSELILSGKKTPEQIISSIEHKAKLTEAHKAEILSWSM